ncbi:hypothetical protein [Nocardioides bruguierae]|uniref:hypothetical protein n=1 Tax=Nocardioides bruguierae TaxID=2945102 RepID=UPI00202253CD|nr:hypothetical protein [Nocardioides bruguierae]MCL8027599.1 hypothetical protein [Nocardioides bruguierae]
MFKYLYRSARCRWRHDDRCPHDPRYHGQPAHRSDGARRAVPAGRPTPRAAEPALSRQSSAA